MADRVNERVRSELLAGGLFGQRPLVDEEAQAIARGREGCGACDRGSASQKAITHHNLRASEFGERSYPCMKRTI